MYVCIWSPSFGWLEGAGYNHINSQRVDHFLGDRVWCIDQHVVHILFDNVYVRMYVHMYVFMLIIRNVCILYLHTLITNKFHPATCMYVCIYV